MNSRWSKCFWLMSFLVVLLGASSVANAGPKEKIAVVNVSQLFDEYEKTKSFDSEFQTEGRIKQEERDALIHDIRRLRDEQSLLGKDARADKQDEIEGKLKELDMFDASIKRTLGKKRNEAVRDVFKDIESALESYGERKGYDFILNDRAMLYRNDRFDITADVIKELNNAHRKGSN